MIHRPPFLFPEIPPIEPDDLFDATELAAFLGVKRSTFTNYRGTGRARTTWPWLPAPVKHIQGRPVWDANVVRRLHQEQSTS